MHTFTDSEAAIEAYAEVDQPLRQVVGIAGGVGRDVDGDVGAAGGEDAHTAVDVAVDRELVSVGTYLVLCAHVLVKVFIADSEGDVDVVDAVEGVGVGGKVLADDGKEFPLGERPDNKMVATEGGQGGDAGNGDAEGVAVFLVMESDKRLIEPAPRQRVPLQEASAADTESELVGAGVGGVGDDPLDKAAGGGSFGQYAHKGGKGGGEGVHGWGGGVAGATEDNELEEAAGIGQQVLAGHAVVERP